MPAPDYYRQFVDRWEEAEAARAEAERVLGEAAAVYPPAPEPPPAPPMAEDGPRPGWLARLFERVDGSDRLVTYPLWVLATAATHLLLAIALVAVVLTAAAVMAAVLRLVLPLWAAALLAAPTAALATAGTWAGLWRSFRRRLAQFPW